jgi:DNA-binding winged helix-turn-helix (wHTH) protein
LTNHPSFAPKHFVLHLEIVMSPSHLAYAFGPFLLEPSEHRLTQHGAVKDLAPKAFETLLALLKRDGRLVTKRSLIEEVWANTHVCDESLTRNICVIRKSLGVQPNGISYIETIPCIGYRFAAPITVRKSFTAEAPSACALTVFPFRGTHPHHPTDHFGFALANAAVRRMREAKRFLVSVHNDDQTISGLDTLFATPFYLEGSVQQTFGKLRIVVQLVHANDPVVVGADIFDVVATEPLDSIAERIVRFVHETLSGAAHAHSPHDLFVSPHRHSRHPTTPHSPMSVSVFAPMRKLDDPIRVTT